MFIYKTKITQSEKQIFLCIKEEFDGGSSTPETLPREKEMVY